MLNVQFRRPIVIDYNDLYTFPRLFFYDKIKTNRQISGEAIQNLKHIRSTIQNQSRHHGMLMGCC